MVCWQAGVLFVWLVRCVHMMHVQLQTNPRRPRIAGSSRHSPGAVGMRSSRPGVRRLRAIPQDPQPTPEPLKHSGAAVVVRCAGMTERLPLICVAGLGHGLFQCFSYKPRSFHCVPAGWQRDALDLHRHRFADRPDRLRGPGLVVALLLVCDTAGQANGVWLFAWLVTE